MKAMVKLKPAAIDSLVYNGMLNSFGVIKGTRLEPLWRRLYERFRIRGRHVETKVHGYNAIMNFGFPYPLTIRTYPNFNTPLLELVDITWKVKKRKIRLVDVGAAIGDTALLVEANFPNVISEYVCVDGDPAWYSYLEHNLAGIPHKRLIFGQLSRTGGEHQEVVRINYDTTVALGAQRVKTLPLDQALSENSVDQVDLLKVDVDGFDGEVLLGAEATLRRDLPNLLFEWHPSLCQKTSGTYREHFALLSKLGYRVAVWYNKFGEFSHFGALDDFDSLERMANYCQSTTSRYDWHYDVMVLSPASEGLAQQAAELEFCKRRPSRR